jgi:hypothetical protein
MDCRILLVALLALSLASAMTIEVEETFPGTVHYRVVERGASGSTLYIIAKLGEAQQSVTTVTGFNGIAEGEITLTKQGEYTITAKNLDTGAQASATIAVPQSGTLAMVQESSEALEEQVVESQTTIPLGEETSSLTLALAAALLILIAVILIYGNPFRASSPKKGSPKKTQGKRKRK